MCTFSPVLLDNARMINRLAQIFFPCLSVYHIRATNLNNQELAIEYLYYDYSIGYYIFWLEGYGYIYYDHKNLRDIKTLLKQTMSHNIFLN